MADFTPGPAVAAEVINVAPYSLPGLEYFICAESAAGVAVALGETKKIVSHTEAESDWILTEIGATDADHTEYWLKIGDDETSHTKEPFGLLNNPHKFDPTLKVPKGVEAGYYVKLDAGAPGPVTYVAKFIGYKEE